MANEVPGHEGWYFGAIEQRDGVFETEVYKLELRGKVEHMSPGIIIQAADRQGLVKKAQEVIDSRHQFAKR